MYPVDSPARTDFSDAAFPVTVIDSIVSRHAHRVHGFQLPQDPRGTRRLLPGAAVAGYVTSAAVPPVFL